MESVSRGVKAEIEGKLLSDLTSFNRRSSLFCSARVERLNAVIALFQ